MKIAVYAGSFNPWHKGHEDILKKALNIFDKVYIMQGYNPSKLEQKDKRFLCECSKYGDRVECGIFNGLLSEAIKAIKPDALIRGLRNGYDLEYEANLQYWNEDLGVSCPTVYFICDRNLTHISSSSIREFNSITSQK